MSQLAFFSGSFRCMPFRVFEGVVSWGLLLLLASGRGGRKLFCGEMGCESCVLLHSSLWEILLNCRTSVSHADSVLRSNGEDTTQKSCRLTFVESLLVRVKWNGSQCGVLWLTSLGVSARNETMTGLWTRTGNGQLWRASPKKENRQQ